MNDIPNNNGFPFWDPVERNNKKQKPKKMLKLFKGAGRVLKGVAKGVLDTVLPNTHQTIEITAPTLTQDKQVNVNWPRLITAVTVWILLILVLAGKISFSDIKDFVNSAVNVG